MPGWKFPIGFVPLQRAFVFGQDEDRDVAHQNGSVLRLDRFAIGNHEMLRPNPEAWFFLMSSVVRMASSAAYFSPFILPSRRRPRV